MKSTIVRSGSVHILETLRPGDLRTGERLFDWLQPAAAAMNPAIESHFWRESTAAGVFGRLQHVLDDVRQTGRAPILHIEAHGSPEGIETTSGELLTWEALKQPLTSINTTCRLNLIVLLAACDGADLGRVVQLTDRAPVWAIIGPRRPVCDDELEDADRAFYRTLFSTRNGGAAWRAMNDAIKGGDRPFLLLHSETMFKWIMEGYFKTYCSEEALLLRDAKSIAIAEDLARRGADPLSLTEAHEAYRAFIRDHRGRFDEVRNRFFMCDLCPENDDRFEVSFEECLKAQDGTTTG